MTFACVVMVRGVFVLQQQSIVQYPHNQLVGRVPLWDVMRQQGDHCQFIQRMCTNAERVRIFIGLYQEPLRRVYNAVHRCLNVGNELWGTVNTDSMTYNSAI